MSAAVFIAPNGQPAGAAIRAELSALTTPSTGDLLFAGQIFRTRIRQRTFAGLDVNGAPFAPYSTRGPYYLYPNKDSASGRTPAGRAARATASKNRHAKTGRIGIRTPTGIKYESYAAAKSAHGVANVNLYGMEQHPHMLDAMMVRCNGAQSSPEEDAFQSASEMSAFEQNYPANQLTLGFYGPEAERARGHNEGTSKLPQREFFALNQGDLDLAARGVAQRMALRARSGRGFASAPTAISAVDPGGEITLDDVGF